MTEAAKFARELQEALKYSLRWPWPSEKQIRFQFLFESGEPIYLVASASMHRFNAGRVKAPDITLYIDRHDTLTGLLGGTIDGMEAFMLGEFRADGHIVLSQMLLAMFLSSS